MSIPACRYCGHVSSRLKNYRPSDPAHCIHCGKQLDNGKIGNAIVPMSNNISEAKRCEFCGTINDTHHSAQCIDTDKGATNRPISEDKNRDYTAEGYRIVSRRRRYKMSSFNKELDEILNPVFEEMVGDKVGLVGEFSADILNDENKERQYVREFQKKTEQAIQDLFIKLVEKEVIGEDELETLSGKNADQKRLGRNQLRHLQRTKLNSIKSDK